MRKRKRVPPVRRQSRLPAAIRKLPVLYQRSGRRGTMRDGQHEWARQLPALRRWERLHPPCARRLRLRSLRRRPALRRERSARPRALRRLVGLDGAGFATTDGLWGRRPAPVRRPLRAVPQIFYLHWPFAAAPLWLLRAEQLVRLHAVRAHLRRKQQVFHLQRSGRCTGSCGRIRALPSHVGV